MRDGNRYPAQEPQGHEALFAIRESIVLDRERWPFEHPRRVSKIEAMLPKIQFPLPLIPEETHILNVYTKRHGVNARLGPLTTLLIAGGDRRGPCSSSCTARDGTDAVRSNRMFDDLLVDIFSITDFEDRNFFAAIIDEIDDSETTLPDPVPVFVTGQLLGTVRPRILRQCLDSPHDSLAIRFVAKAGDFLTRGRLDKQPICAHGVSGREQSPQTRHCVASYEDRTPPSPRRPRPATP